MTPRQWVALAAIAYEGVALGSRGKLPTISKLCRRVAAHFIDDACPTCRAIAEMERTWRLPAVPRQHKWQTRPPR